MMHRPLSAASIIVLIALPARAERKNFAITLEYTPGRYAAQCPNEAFLRGEVARRLGYDLFVAEASKHLTVTVSFGRGQYRVAGEMRDDAGKVVLSEVFDEATCEAAIMDEVNSMAAEFVRPPEPCPVCPPAAKELTCPPVAPQAPVPPVAPAPPLAERPRAQAGLASAFSIGVAPVVVGGVSGFLGIRWKTVSIALEGSVLFAPSATIENISPSSGYSYLAPSMTASGCYHSGWALGCVDVKLGMLSVGTSDPQKDASPTVNVGFGLRFGGEWPLIPGIDLRAYSEFLVRPISGLLRDSATRYVIWPGSTVSGSIGVGPVFSFASL